MCWRAGLHTCPNIDELIIINNLYLMLLTFSFLILSFFWIEF